MADIAKFTPEMRSYFNSLPKFLQESIVQSKDKVQTLDELDAIAKKMSF